MNLAEEFRLVLDTLRAHKVRTVLTLLGIILGVGTLVALSSALESSGKYMERGLQQASGEDVVSISSHWWGGDNENRKAPPLNRYDSRALDTAPRLGDSLVLNRYSMRVPWGERWGQNIQAVGTVPMALRFYQLEVDKGRFVAQADVRSRTAVAVLGDGRLGLLVAQVLRSPGATSWSSAGTRRSWRCWMRAASAPARRTPKCPVPTWWWTPPARRRGSRAPWRWSARWALWC